MTYEDQVEFASIDSLAKVDPDNEVQLRVCCSRADMLYMLNLD